jgi:hypothetical protein
MEGGHSLRQAYSKLALRLETGPKQPSVSREGEILFTSIRRLGRLADNHERRPVCRVGPPQLSFQLGHAEWWRVAILDKDRSLRLLRKIPNLTAHEA